MVNHRINYYSIRALIYNAIAKAQVDNNGMLLSQAKNDLVFIDDTWTFYETATKEFNTNNSDETMINLIGLWARMSRIMRDMDDKYGIK